MIKNNMGNTLVFGASGQLGQCLKLVADQRNLTGFLFPSEDEANILDVEKLTLLFEKHQPQYCINCAAYTAVDKAEDDVDLARKINKDGAANLAKLCAQYKTTLIHVSTDFVFEGNVLKLLTEDDVANPINVYGLTKLEGEQEIIKVLPAHFILRTSWLYSEYGNNFVKTMMKLGTERDELSIIADQVGTPTYAIDLAGAIIDIMLSGKPAYGVYHYSNEGVTSWYDFAVGIFELANIRVDVKPITSDEYKTKAVRPAFSVMNKSKIKTTFNISIPYWRNSLSTCVNKLQ